MESYPLTECKIFSDALYVIITSVETFYVRQYLPLKIYTETVRRDFFHFGVKGLRTHARSLREEKLIHCIYHETLKVPLRYRRRTKGERKGETGDSRSPSVDGTVSSYFCKSVVSLPGYSSP